MQSCLHHKVFFLLDPIIICSKQLSLFPLFLLIALVRIHKANSLLQIPYPMAREWKLCLFFIFMYSLTFSTSLTYRHLMRENTGLNNVETYSEYSSIRMARSLTRCGSINNMSLCNITSLSHWSVLRKFLCSHLLNFCELFIERAIWLWNGHMNMRSAGQFETSTLMISSLLDFEVSSDRLGDVRFWVHFSPDVT